METAIIILQLTEVSFAIVGIYFIIMDKPYKL